MSTPITLNGTDILTIVTSARFVKYTHGAKRGLNLEVSGKHGTVWTPDKLFGEADILLEVHLPQIADDDGLEALSKLAAIFSSQNLVTLGQTDPYKGSVQAHVEQLVEAIPTQDRLTYLYALRNPAGCWEDQTESTAASGTPPAITTGGDRPIDDMVLTYAGPGYFEYTDELGDTYRFTVDAGAGAGTYILDFGNRTIQKAGVDQDEFLTVTDDFAMKWSPNTAQTIDSDVGVSAAWRNKWA
jgi:hypothetical protein